MFLLSASKIAVLLAVIACVSSLPLHPDPHASIGVHDCGTQLDEEGSKQRSETDMGSVIEIL